MLEANSTFSKDTLYVQSLQLNSWSEVSFQAQDNNKWVQVRQDGQEPRSYSLTGFVAYYGFSYELYLADLAYEKARSQGRKFSNNSSEGLSTAA